MSGRILHQLGYRVHRLRILMRQSDWDYLQGYADHDGLELPDVVALFAEMWADHLRGQVRVSLTPLGEKVTDEFATYTDAQGNEHGEY